MQDDLRGIQDVRKTVALCNVSKHNQGYLDRDSSDFAKHLVDNCGLPDGWEIEYLDINLERLIFSAYLYGLGVVERAVGSSIPLLHAPEAELRAAFESEMIPDALRT